MAFVDFDFTSTVRGRVTPADILAIATRTEINRATEREVCHSIGLKEDTWYQWKRRHKNDVRFRALIDRIRERRIDALVSRIDDASLGKNMKQPDWRAAAWLAGIVDRERYGDQKVIAQQTVVNTTHNNFLFIEAARKIYGNQAQLPSDQPPRELKDAMPKE